MGNKKNKKKKDKDELVVGVKVLGPLVMAKPEPKKEIEIPSGIRELWCKGDFENRGEMIALFNNWVRRGYMIKCYHSERLRSNIYKVVYVVKKVG